MIVTVDGLITSKELKQKADDKGAIKISTELLLAQPGQKVQTTIRLEGDKRDSYEVLTPAMFSGELMTWRTRDGVGMMVMVRDGL